MGFGIFALVFSLSLLILGVLENEKASEPSAFSLPSTEQPDFQLSPGDITLSDAVLLVRSETSDYHHQVRKFPVTLGVLFLLLNENIEESPVLLNAIDLSAIPLKDYPVVFRQLII